MIFTPSLMKIFRNDPANDRNVYSTFPGDHSSTTSFLDDNQTFPKGYSVYFILYGCFDTDDDFVILEIVMLIL